MNAIELSLFVSRLAAVCDEMGATLRRTALSPNIKDRLDYSCAVFNAKGELCAQAAHIPVHLGSMAYAMSGIVDRLVWQPNDMVILNDPYLGGTHLPDVTVIAPVFITNQLIAFVVNRAHHADIGADSPGSMPLSTSLEEEGFVIAPCHLMRQDLLDEKILRDITQRTGNPQATAADITAQISTNKIGAARLSALVNQIGVIEFNSALAALNDYGESLARAALKSLPAGIYRFEDFMDDDGHGQFDVSIRAELTIADSTVHVNFSGTAAQTKGNINCPLSVAAAAVYYVFRCLMPPYTPACFGTFRPMTLFAPEGCLLNAQRPAAVAAGNVETSTRIVDVLLGALSEIADNVIPAASHGSMNNIAMGNRDRSSGSQVWDYYETIGGGMGAGARGGGWSGVQTHMTNTLNTPAESIEMHYPVRIRRYAIRPNSGGDGTIRGGDGLIREFEFTGPAQVTLLTERRRHPPWGLSGGQAGAPGHNVLNGKTLAPKTSFSVCAGDRVTIETPGGGGYGEKSG